MKIPFLSLSAMHSPIREEMLMAFQDVLDSNWFILGDRLKSFEREYADFNEVKYAVGVSNGLDALHLALKILGIGEGDEVILPSNTYIATVLAVLYVKATPVFVEPSEFTYNINVRLIEEKISSRTKCIIPVHLYGQACEMDRIMDIATRYGLFVVEDNAQSHSARYNQKMTGSFGHINATSFYPGKNLGALGDGGAITTNMEEYASDAIVYRNYGSRKKYYNEVVGFNMRLDECQAAILSVKLRRVLEWTNQRNELASFYNELFEGIEEVVVPVCADNASHVYHLYVIQARNRDLLQDHLSKCGIGTLIHYPIPPHLQQACSTLGYVKGSFPIAEKLASSVLSLPLWPGMSYSDVEYVCSTIRSFYRS